MNFGKHTSLIFLGLQAAIFCAFGQNQKNQKPITTHCAGEMRQVMRQGNLASHARLDTLLAKPNLFAIGPLEGLQGEVTVINSVPFVTKAKGRSAETTTDSTSSAAFLVYAQVPGWEEFVIPSFVTDITTLEEFIVQMAKKQRFKFGEPIPFQIKGPIKSALIHVVNKTDNDPDTPGCDEKYKVYFQPANISADITGFYSSKHQGVFTHHDSFSHLHLVTADRQLSGHVDKLQIVPGKTKLLLPKWPDSQRRKEFKLNKSKKPYKEPVY